MVFYTEVTLGVGDSFLHPLNATLPQCSETPQNPNANAAVTD
jgi:hypothetical protein